MTDLTLSESRILAWHTLPCRECGRPVDQRCRTAAGAYTIPHRARMDDLAAYLLGAASRQAEIDGLLSKSADDKAALTVVQAQATVEREVAAALVAELRARITALEAAPAPTPPPIPVPDLAGWAPRYATNFDTLAGWTVYDNQTQTNDNSVNMARNVTTGTSGLTISAKRESGASRPFTSGEIVGKGAQVVPNYFRAEVVGTFEDVSGIWPCLLWFRPVAGNDGEIDVMEWMGGMWSGTEKRVAITMHNEYGSTQDSAKKPLTLKANPWYDPAAEHTYTVEKVPGSIKVSIDDRLISTFTAADKPWWARIMEVPGREWYPRITMQVGAGATTKVVPDPAASFTRSEMRVRSFKLWTRP